VHELYTRGRHAAISSIMSVQRYRVLSPIVRVNATALIVFRLRNTKEYDALSVENSAVVSRDSFTAICELATSEPYSFLCVSAMANTAGEMFWKNVEHAIPVE
jgi:hypothetical protein